ncbi:protein BTG1-like [Rhincodon typus]|uniref:protein BTG1-like n=1 Tax=Rhincodon typus TaxID=259920 RepID=UPI0009A31689|nr:protein BTG1-like [Rhincodon typus]
MYVLGTWAEMKPEISAAVGFICKLLRTKATVDERQLQTFCQSLQDLLAEHYQHHWFPDKPCKGSGYRCIRINHKMDPIIWKAANRIGLSDQQVFQLLPSELTLWVDPYEVSYRIGEDGSICVLYEAHPGAHGPRRHHHHHHHHRLGAGSPPLPSLDGSRISCKDELLLGRTSPSKTYNMMTVSS